MSETPFKVSQQKPITMPLLILLSLLATAAATAGAWQSTKTDIKAVKDEGEMTRTITVNNETRLRAVERRLDTDIAEIKTNLSWLKEREQARAAAGK